MNLKSGDVQVDVNEQARRPSVSLQKLPPMSEEQLSATGLRTPSAPASPAATGRPNTKMDNAPDKDSPALSRSQSSSMLLKNFDRLSPSPAPSMSVSRRNSFDQLRLDLERQLDVQKALSPRGSFDVEGILSVVRTHTHKPHNGCASQHVVVVVEHIRRRFSLDALAIILAILV